MLGLEHIKQLLNHKSAWQLAGLFLLHKTLVWFVLPQVMSQHDWSPVWQYDNLWYQHIAQSGYQPIPQLSQPLGAWAFAPLYPTLARVTAQLLSLTTRASLLAISQLSHALSVWLMYRLTAKMFDKSTAWTATLGLIFSPVAWIFSLAYSEALFLLLSLLYLSTRTSWLKTVWLGLLPLTRFNGLIWLTAEIKRKFDQRQILAITLPLATLALFLLWAQWQHQQAWLFPLQLQQFWHRKFLPFPAILGLTFWQWQVQGLPDWKLAMEQLAEVAWLTYLGYLLWRRGALLPAALQKTAWLFFFLVLSWPMYLAKEQWTDIWPLIGAVRYLTAFPVTWWLFAVVWKNKQPSWLIINLVWFCFSYTLYLKQIYVP